jgi:hypothetical protein
VCKPSLIHNGTAPFYCNETLRCTAFWKPRYRRNNYSDMITRALWNSYTMMKSGRVSFRYALPGPAPPPPPSCVWTRSAYLGRASPATFSMRPAEFYWRQIYAMLCVRIIPFGVINAQKCRVSRAPRCRGHTCDMPATLGIRTRDSSQDDGLGPLHCTARTTTSLQITAVLCLKTNCLTAKLNTDHKSQKFVWRIFTSTVN